MTVASNEALCSPAELGRWREELTAQRSPSAKSVRICIGTGCAAKGSRRLYDLFAEAMTQTDGQVEAVKCVGCHGFCERGPIVIVEPGEILYQRVEEPDVEEIFRETVIAGNIVESLLYQDPCTGEKVRNEEGIPF